MKSALTSRPPEAKIVIAMLPKNIFSLVSAEIDSEVALLLLRFFPPDMPEPLLALPASKKKSSTDRNFEASPCCGYIFCAPGETNPAPKCLAPKCPRCCEPLRLMHIRGFTVCLWESCTNGTVGATSLRHCQQFMQTCRVSGFWQDCWKHVQSSG